VQLLAFGFASRAIDPVDFELTLRAGGDQAAAVAVVNQKTGKVFAVNLGRPAVGRDEVHLQPCQNGPQRSDRFNRAQMRQRFKDSMLRTLPADTGEQFIQHAGVGTRGTRAACSGRSLRGAEFRCQLIVLRKHHVWLGLPGGEATLQALQ
jgi:hypothetical protein